MVSMSATGSSPTSQRRWKSTAPAPACRLVSRMFCGDDDGVHLNRLAPRGHPACAVVQGSLGGVLLVVAATGVALRGTRVSSKPRASRKLLSKQEYAVFCAIADRIVPGDGATPAWPRARDVDRANQADVILAWAHPDVGGASDGCASVGCPGPPRSGVAATSLRSTAPATAGRPG